MTDLRPSLIRTIVPMLVGWILGQLATRGLHIDTGLAEQVVTWLVTAVYYAIARVLETRFKPIWGWLLGLPKAPAYQPKHAADDPPPEPIPGTVLRDVPVDPLDAPSQDYGSTT